MSVISVAKTKKMKMEYANGYARADITLPTHPDVSTFKCAMKAGTKFEPKLYKDKSQLFIFSKGTGYIGTPTRAFNITEVALFVPFFDNEKVFFQAGTDLEYVEIIVNLGKAEMDRLNYARFTLPRFKLMSECDTYFECFKGKDVISRTLIQFRRLARVSMGFVKGPGPDHVGEHSHEDLMQWYYLLDGAKFIYTAGGESVECEEGDWIGIPKQTPHAIDAPQGGCINYIWFEINVNTL
jgi:mannose-6-phosphate isomerase-like protein (cupin superfamily)